MKNRTSENAIACDISESVKKKVWERDNGRCVVCGSAINVMPNAHIVPRSQGGLGIETNIVTLCSGLSENRCHDKYDHGTAKEMKAIDDRIVRYMKSIYGETWNKADQSISGIVTEKYHEEHLDDNWFDDWE